MLGKKAFTLIELLIVLAISAILLVAMVPTTRDLWWRSSSTSEINKLVGLLQYARTAAIELHVPVSLCPSNDGKHCGGQWQNGVLLFTDPAASGNADHKQILRVVNGFSQQAKLLWRSFTGKEFINIQPSPVSANAAGSFLYCPVSNYNHYAKRLVVNRLGRVRVSNASKKQRQLCKTAIA